MDFEEFGRLARLTVDQLAQVKKLCADDPAYLTGIEAADLYADPPDGLGVPKAVARVALQAVREAQTEADAPAAPSELKVTIEAPPKAPGEMDANELINLMEADPSRVQDLAPHFFRVCERGLVATEDGSGVDWDLTREAENADGYDLASPTWRGRRLFRTLEDLTGRKPPLRDPFYPTEALLPDGANPGRAHTYASLGHIDKAIPMLHHARAEGLLGKVDEHEAIHRLSTHNHPWAVAIRRAWSRLSPTQQLLWADRAREIPSSDAPPLSPRRPSTPSALVIPRGGERRALHEFLKSAFAVGQLQRLLGHNATLRKLCESVQWRESLSAVVFDVVSSAQSHGMTEHLLLAARRERPDRAAEVDVLMRAFGFRRASPTRREVHEALWGMSFGDWRTFVSTYLPEKARRVIAGVDGRGRRIGILLDHYDVPHRGLDQLLALIP